MKIAVCDNNKEYLSKARETLGTSQADDVEVYEIDVSKIEQWRELKEKVQKRFGGVDFLMLNAGIGLKGGWEDTGYFHKVAFLPVLQRGLDVEAPPMG